jgi:hypothetical protein
VACAAGAGGGTVGSARAWSRLILAAGFFVLSRAFWPCLSRHSVFHLHNETINIWTHGVGALLFLGFIFHLLLHSRWMAPMLPPPQHPLVIRGAHSQELFMRVTVLQLEESADWEVASRFPSVSFLQYHLQSLKLTSLKSVSEGVCPWVACVRPKLRVVCPR